MTKLSAQIGRWAAWSQTIMGYAWAVGYIAFLAIFPLQPWTNIEAFAADLGSPYFKVLTILQVFAFMQALLMLVITVALYDYAPSNKKILAHLGILFALAFAILSSMHYYIQWVGVRQSILRDDLVGLGFFVQFNFDSPAAAINMLGWMFFYGLTTLVLAPLFEGNRLEAWIRWGLFINGIGCILSGVLLAFGQKWVFLFWTILISIAWYVYPLLGILFNRLKAQATE
jgi:hypothetical protein